MGKKGLNSRRDLCRFVVGNFRPRYFYVFGNKFAKWKSYFITACISPFSRLYLQALRLSPSSKCSLLVASRAHDLLSLSLSLSILLWHLSFCLACAELHRLPLLLCIKSQANCRLHCLRKRLRSPLRQAKSTLCICAVGSTFFTSVLSFFPGVFASLQLFHFLSSYHVNFIF